MCGQEKCGGAVVMSVVVGGKGDLTIQGPEQGEGP